MNNIEGNNQLDQISYYHSQLSFQIPQLLEMKAKNDIHKLRIRLFEKALQEETQKGNFVAVRHYEYLIQNYLIVQDVNHNEYITKELYIQQLEYEIQILKLNRQMNEINIQNNQLIL